MAIFTKQGLSGVQLLPEHILDYAAASLSGPVHLSPRPVTGRTEAKWCADSRMT